ncbi:hypothetical protein JD844_006756 [Phrynosoma platyrhinos]|uniref:Mini-chromosome maintenance complex-binding protein n=1 Tax=Phrynosoma platyrhinos TaxID=52577 RepID=A0ABQ7T229_PHRPL|nr:hypothetical protein JD844_006756 [Phrynosoma platyrhinos]
MPCVADWLNCPLSIVQGIFAQDSPNPEWERKVIEYFREKLKENNAANWVPSLNDVPLHYLKPNSLVKFRCMVQDMFDPEFYMNVYETVDIQTKSRVLHFGKYRDIAECSPHQEIDLNPKQIVTADRQTFYCVPVPGESTWVKEISFVAFFSIKYVIILNLKFTPIPVQVKLEFVLQHLIHQVATKEVMRKMKIWSCTHRNRENNIWIYENGDSFKLNDVLEVYGILSVDPVLNIVNNDERENSSSPVESMDCMDTVEEQRVHSPPASLVPRIHVILAQKLQHINPLVPACFHEEESKSFISSFMSELSPVRAELLGFLTHAFLGDSLAAEYLILHLISTVYARRDVLPLGKFTVNLSGCPRNSVFTEHIYRIIQQLVPASYRLQMTIENMNQLQFNPHKDYTANRLVSGVLQLASNTSLVIDETLLEQGQLDSRGVHNVTALGHLITWQKVDYDFSYHQMEFPCNINVLITSEGRSLLPSDCQVQLQPQLIPPNMEEYMNSLLTAVLPSILNKFRIYLSLLRLLDYSISDEVTKAVEDDFVEMRKNDPESITADDLHRTLLVARFLSLSAGQTTLSRERWLRAKQLETLRKARLQEQQCVNGNEL